MLSWTGFSSGLKFVLCIHPTDEELSLHPRQHDSGGRFPSIASTQMEMICAMNSSTLFMCELRRDGGM